MKKKVSRNKKDDIQDNIKVSLNPDDSLNPIKVGNNEQPEIYKIIKKGGYIDRKNFFKSTASLIGLASLGSLIKGCEESFLDIETNGQNCTCHAVCACNTDWDNGERYDKGNSYFSQYDKNQICTCDLVCTCNSVCTCDSHCVCNSEGGGSGGGGGYISYWYPN